MHANKPHQGRSSCPANGNNAPLPISSGRSAVATTHAAITGIRLRGFHSNSSSSTASKTAAIGVPNMAVMPAAAPATSRVFRSAALRRKHCANSEPIAPPVMMIGPSAPKGPPLPIEMAEDSGLRTATLGAIRLSPIRMASIASGMPWPRIFSEPKRAINPITRPPRTGAITIHASGLMPASEWLSALKVRSQTTFVTSAMACRSNQAATRLKLPIRTAMATRMRTRRWVVKSPSRGRERSNAEWDTAAFRDVILSYLTADVIISQCDIIQWMIMPKKQPRSPSHAPAVMDESAYRNLALFRKALRSFLAFSEQAARKAGLTPQQHQAVLVIRGFGLEQGVTIGDLAGHLLLKPQTAVGLVDRLVEGDLVARVPDGDDGRRVWLKLTEKAEKILKDLSADHLAEIGGNAPRLIKLLRDLSIE